MKRRYRVIGILLALAALCSLAACGGKPSAPVSIDCAGLYEQLLALPEAGEMTPVSERRIQNYYGIDASSCKQLVMAVSQDALRVDEIWLIEAADEDSARALAQLAESRIAQLSAETQNYSPEQYAVASAGRVLQVGANVALFISPAADAMTALFQKAVS